MRDAEVAYPIHPIVRKYLLTVEDTTKALYRMRRAEGCERSSDYERLDMSAASLTKRKSAAKGESAPAIEAGISVDNLVSKNN